MRYLQLFGKTVREEPKDAKLISHKLLYKAGFIRELVSGRYSILPLGLKVMDKIKRIIKEEMDLIGAQQLSTPTLHPIGLWKKTNRTTTMGPTLMRVIDRRKAEFVLGATHEEVFVDLVQKFNLSQKDLPVTLYQFSNKFRDELRARGGLVRVREFMMKDAYSFNESPQSLDKSYHDMYNAYKKIFDRLGIPTIAVEADSGAIGGKFSHEFMFEDKDGEDTFVECDNCDYSANTEKAQGSLVNKNDNAKRDLPICQKCKKGSLRLKKGIEMGHVFRLDYYYSKPLDAAFTAEDGSKQLFLMGCYGIGLERAMAAVVEKHHDQKGIIWPKTIAPFQVSLIAISDNAGEVKKIADQIYQKLVNNKVEVLYDDREVTPGVKFADFDLIGIPVRLVISQKTNGKIEWKNRNKNEISLLTVEEVLIKLKST